MLLDQIERERIVPGRDRRVGGKYRRLPDLLKGVVEARASSRMIRCLSGV